MKDQIIDILAIKTYVSDKGSLIFLKLTIVKTVIFGAALSKTQRKTSCFVVGVYPFHSES